MKRKTKNTWENKFSKNLKNKLSDFIPPYKSKDILVLITKIT